MHFYALFNNYMVMTDDYTKAEVKENKHIEHIISDVKSTCKSPDFVHVIVLDSYFTKVHELDVAV